MQPGGFILDLLRETHGTEWTILFLRHSVRDSFTGVPDHLRQGVGINPEGICRARNFGRSLAEVLPGRRLLLGHTVARRCRMTAECIGEGYSPCKDFRILGCRPDVQDPVADPARYIALREEFGWPGLMKRWLNREISYDILADPHRYARTQLENLVSFHEGCDADLLVVVAHDITLLPIVLHVFGRPITALDFLNGIVITPGRTGTGIRFADADCSVKAELDPW
jgi:hypothetical protein